MSKQSIKPILNGFERELENGRSLYLYRQVYNWKVCAGPTGDDGYEDGY